MARQSGHRLAEERKRHGLTQAQLADVMSISPGCVWRIQRGDVFKPRCDRSLREAVGGRLDIVAKLHDHTSTVTTHRRAGSEPRPQGARREGVPSSTSTDQHACGTCRGWGRGGSHSQHPTAPKSAAEGTH
jgi:DNA-binding XRE family transcriptional regulator